MMLDTLHRVTTISTGPTVEPISLDEAKVHARIEESEDDAYVLSLIVAAREYVQKFTRRQLITATWKLLLDDFPGVGGTIELPFPPLQSVGSITYIDNNGDSQTLDSSLYRVDTDTEPGRVTPAYGEQWESARSITGAVTVTYDAGYGATGSTVPMAIRQALKLLVSQWYENREPTISGTITKVPFAAESLLWPYRVNFLT